MSQDRTKASFRALAALDPMIPYRVLYRGKVVAQDGDSDVVDVRPDDPDLPDMAQIPLRHGVPGLRVSVVLGSYLLVGWDDGRPDRPFAALWGPDTRVKQISIVCSDLRLGGRGAREHLVQGDSYRQAEDQMLAGLQAGFSALVSAAQGPYMPLMPGLAACLQAIVVFQASAVAARGYLSPEVATT